MGWFQILLSFEKFVNEKEENLLLVGLPILNSKLEKQSPSLRSGENESVRKKGVTVHVRKGAPSGALLRKTRPVDFLSINWHRTVKAN